MKTVKYATCAAALAFMATNPACAKLSIPRATQSILTKLNLKPTILSGLNKELAVPAKWVSEAKKEGKLTVLTTERARRFESLVKPFRERYPYIKLNYSLAASSERRLVQPLTAFEQGRYLGDVIVGLAGDAFLFKQAHAFVNLRDLPTYGTAFADIHDPDGLAVSFRTRRWCLGYNSNEVKASQLPRTWDELVDSSKWANRKIGLGDRPNLWLQNLWNAKGDQWGRQFTDKLFALKPQLRKEGLDAMLSLLIAGEFQLSLPSAGNRVLPWVQKGAPISYFCPEPITLSTSQLGVLRGSPDVYAAKIYANWTLSKEGQIAQFFATGAPPVSRDLQIPRFIPFAQQVQGKKIALAGGAGLAKKVLVYWQKKWNEQGSGR